MHRLTKPIHLFTAPAPGEGGEGGQGGQGGDGGEPKSFTQAEVDEIVGRTRREERTKAASKYSDYDDLKTRAGEATNLEGRITELETKGAAAELRALRAEIAGEFGISTKRGEKGEASDADLFLTATDEDGMRKQAERFAGHESARKKNGNHAPREGEPTSTATPDGRRDWLRSLQQD